MSRKFLWGRESCPATRDFVPEVCVCFALTGSESSGWEAVWLAERVPAMARVNLNPTFESQLWFSLPKSVEKSFYVVKNDRIEKGECLPNIYPHSKTETTISRSPVYIKLTSHVSEIRLTDVQLDLSTPRFISMWKRTNTARRTFDQGFTFLWDYHKTLTCFWAE